MTQQKQTVLSMWTNRDKFPGARKKKMPCEGLYPGNPGSQMQCLNHSAIPSHYSNMNISMLHATVKFSSWHMATALWRQIKPIWIWIIMWDKFYGVSTILKSFSRIYQFFPFQRMLIPLPCLRSQFDFFLHYGKNISFMQNSSSKYMLWTIQINYTIQILQEICQCSLQIYKSKV